MIDFKISTTSNDTMHKAESTVHKVFQLRSHHSHALCICCLGDDHSPESYIAMTMGWQHDIRLSEEKPGGYFREIILLNQGIPNEKSQAN